ncbi:hypothetical protein JHK84_050608 [Glycine max]|nr:hypothetical protein JHK84_050608 [Glycine max]
MEHFEAAIDRIIGGLEKRNKIHENSVEGRILHGNSPCELIERSTESIGRLPELPEWIISSAIVGMQGRKDVVRHIWDVLKDELKTYYVLVSAFWLQPEKCLESPLQLCICCTMKDGALMALLTYSYGSTDIDYVASDVAYNCTFIWINRYAKLCQFMEHKKKNMEAESWALLDGILWIKELGLQDITIEVDGKSGVDDLMGCNNSFTDVQIILTKCREVLNFIPNSRNLPQDTADTCVYRMLLLLSFAYRTADTCRRHELHKRELDNVVAVTEAQPSLRQTRTKAEGETTIKPWVAKLELWKCNHKLGATPPRNNKSAIYPSSTTPIEVKGFLGISVGNVQVEQEQPLGESGHGSNIDLVGGSLTDPTLHAFDIDNLVLNDNVEDHFSIEEELEDDGDEDDGGGGDIGDYFIKGLMDI